jgi:hypothetical protein
MHNVNLDLLRASVPFHPDGRSKDPHALHRAEHLTILQAERRNRWLAGLGRIRRIFASVPASAASSDRVLPAKT